MLFETYQDSLTEIHHSLSRIGDAYWEFLYEKENSPAVHYLELLAEMTNSAEVVQGELNGLTGSAWQFPHTVFTARDYSHGWTWIDTFLELLNRPRVEQLLSDPELEQEPEWEQAEDAQMRKYAIAAHRLSKKQIMKFVPRMVQAVHSALRLECAFETIYNIVDEMEQHCSRADPAQQIEPEAPPQTPQRFRRCEETWVQKQLFKFIQEKPRTGTVCGAPNTRRINMRRLKNRQVDVESISTMLKEGLDKLFQSDQYMSFLEMMAQLPNYSYRNILLLLRQCPHASRTRTARGWLTEGRIVKAGERGLRIIAPLSQEDKKEAAKRGRVKKDEFRCIRVFDISQTRPLSGQPDGMPWKQPVEFVPFPFRTEDLQGVVPEFELLMAVLREISPYSIVFTRFDEKQSKKGEAHHGKRMIQVREGMSQLHTIKTVIHEMAHALLHASWGEKQQQEMEAESIAFMVCQHLGLDTSSYSFNYIAGYSFDKKRKELTEFLDTIQKTACYLIDSIDGELEARRNGYDNDDLVVLVNHKTVIQLHNQGYPIYLVYPKQGELFATKKDQLLQHDGPFAVEVEIWRDHGKGAA